jgi:uncharacterized repeat protein (TIGR01451 family)
LNHKDTKITKNDTKGRIIGPSLRVLCVFVVQSLFASCFSPAYGQEPAGTPIVNQAAYAYVDAFADEPGFGLTGIVRFLTGPPRGDLGPTRGRVLDCDGEPLADYRGFTIGLYLPDPRDASNGSLIGIAPLTTTELPGVPGNGVPQGAAPNRANSNPFFLTDEDLGAYSLLLDAAKGELDAGRSYLLIVRPPDGSAYGARRIRIVIGPRVGDRVSYTATALDGSAIDAGDGRTSVTRTLFVAETDGDGGPFGLIDLTITVCDHDQLQILKTGDRAAAEPGDTVVYRIAVRYRGGTPLAALQVTDDLPLGFRLLPGSARAQIGDERVALEVSQNGRRVSLSPAGGALPADQTLSIVYATLVTPEALRSRGINSAEVSGQVGAESGSPHPVRAGPAIYQVAVRQGILSIAGTLVGRVFIDRNADGEQQLGEPGVAGAVLLMDDGNRITTDRHGLFSVANVIAGYRTCALDLGSMPGFRLAPNRRFAERNSLSRLVHLAPGGMARVNFAVVKQEGLGR